MIKEEYFENCEWHIRALFEGEQRVEESQLKCEGVGQTKVSVSYHAVAEDWGEMQEEEQYRRWKLSPAERSSCAFAGKKSRRRW